MNIFAANLTSECWRKLSTHALTPNEEKRPALFCRFVKGVRCKPRTHRLRKSGGRAGLLCHFQMGPQFLEMGPNFWERGPRSCRWDPVWQMRPVRRVGWAQPDRRRVATIGLNDCSARCIGASRGILHPLKFLGPRRDCPFFGHATVEVVVIPPNSARCSDDCVLGLLVSS